MNSRRIWDVGSGLALLAAILTSVVFYFQRIEPQRRLNLDFHTAVQARDEERVAQLLGKGPDVRGTVGARALNTAAWFGNVQLYVDLKGRGARESTRGSGQAGPLQVAAWRGKTEMVGFLLTLQPSQAEKDAALAEAVWSGDVGSAELLVQAGTGLTGLNHMGRTAEEEAAGQTNAEMQQLLRSAR